MILCFQILDLNLNKINFHFGNFLPIFTQQHGKAGQNWHFANFAKSDEIWWFCGDTQNAFVKMQKKKLATVNGISVHSLKWKWLHRWICLPKTMQQFHGYAGNSQIIVQR